MSLAIKPEMIVKVQDPRVDLDKPCEYLVQEGAGQVSWREIAATTAATSSIQFNNINPPSPDTIIDKKIYVKVGFEINFTGPDEGSPLLGYVAPTGVAGQPQIWQPTGTDGPRAFPLAQLCSTVSVQINNTKLTQNVGDYIDPLMRYNAWRDLDETDLSLTPSEQDQFIQYGDWAQYGSARNVLGNYGEQGYRTNRGGFVGVRIISNTNTAAKVYLNVIEPLFISPLDFGMENGRGLFGVQTFQVTLNLKSDLSRLWSHDKVNGNSALNITNIVIGNVDISSPTILFNYLTPKFTDVRPAVNAYPFCSIDRYPTQDFALPAISAGAYWSDTKQVQSTNIQLGVIPKRIYIYARISDSERNNSTSYLSDTYAYIDSISINFNNRSGLLSGASGEQLYRMSVKNGCTMSWTQWSRNVGSVLCIDLMSDLSLSEAEAVGLLGTYQLNYSVQLRSLTSDSGPLPPPDTNTGKAFTLYTTVVSPGVFTIQDQFSEAMIGIISQRDILDAPEVRRIDYEDVHNFYGGSFSGKLKSIGRRVLPKARNALEIADKFVAPVAKTLAPRFGPAIDKGLEFGNELADLTEELVGRGYHPQEAKKMAKKIMANRAGMMAGMSVGGKKASKKEMLKRLQY